MMPSACSKAVRRRPKLLVAAGEWGYGPIVTAEMIVEKVITFADVDLIAHGAASVYATDSPVLASCPRHSVESLDSDYDLIVSVLEPASLIWALQRNACAVSIDNIYWHWRWTTEVVTQAQAVLDASTTDVATTLAALATLGPYAEYTPVYLAAQQVIWQRVAPPFVSLPAAFQAKVVRIEPLLGKVEPTSKRPQLLLSLSGGLINPATDERDWKTYLDVVAGVAARGLTVAREAGWQVVVAAPAPLQELASTALGVAARTFGHDAFHRVVAESMVLAAPKGLSTTVESVASGTALFTLPELHDGSATNYWGLCQAAGCKTSDFSEVFPAAQHSASAADVRVITDLYAAYRRELAGGGEFIIRGRDSFTAFVTACTSEQTRAVITERQHDVLLRVAHGFDGVTQVVDILRATLASPKSATETERG